MKLSLTLAKIYFAYIETNTMFQIIFFKDLKRVYFIYKTRSIFTYSMATLKQYSTYKIQFTDRNTGPP